MSRWILMGLAIVVMMSVLSAGEARAQNANDDWDDEAVARSIKQAVAFLWSRWAGGSWGEGAAGAGGNAGANRGGKTALCAYALLAAGESPEKDKMKQTLAWLAGIDMKGTYARAMRANVWGMIGRNRKYHRYLKADTDWLVTHVDHLGGYDYIPRPIPKGSEELRKRGRYDNSNSQLAVLGVWAGARNGAEVPIGYWKLVERHWLDCQLPDGGWAYMGPKVNANSKSYGSMSVAGLATMFICFDAIYSKAFIACRTDTEYKPITDGLKWLDKNFSATSNPGRGGGHYYYYLYGVERVGLASGYKYFGQKDWYKLGTQALLARQGGGGGWGNEITTAFALLFLARGRHPVLFNKLQYDGSWNCRPRDLANLTRWITRTFERQVNWQIIHLGVPVREWHDAPILYISGATAPKFTDADLDKLRTFVQQGGVIFSEAACNRTAFSLAMQRAYAKMFSPYELKRLPEDHPIYRRELHFDIRSGKTLSAISNGVRLLAVHTPSQVSRAWQLNEYSSSADKFKAAANLYFYVTDKGILPPRGVCRWPRKRSFAAATTVKIIPVKHNGNWNPEPLALTRFAIEMGNRHRVKVDIAKEASPTALDAKAAPVAVMTGTRAFTWTDAERKALAKYLQAGGTLIADAGGGSKAFAKAFADEMAQVLPGAKAGLIPNGHALYTKAGPAIKKVRYRKALRASVYDKTRPRLKGYVLRTRLAVIFSRDDLVAGLVGYPQWGLKGYEPDSAFAIMRNAVLHAAGKMISDAEKPKKDFEFTW